MFPEDRVLVGVVKRKADLKLVLNEGWYRIPQAAMPRGVNVEYLAFFLSGGAAPKKDGSGIYYFAERSGVELQRRKDLLPNEPNHPRAETVYYKVELGERVAKVPPVRNQSKRAFSFIYTTWDRFVNAETIRDLYSADEYYVDRIYHALRDTGLRPDRLWAVESKDTGVPAQLRILCENGTVVASLEREGAHVFMDRTMDDDAILTAIRSAIAQQGGPVTVSIPLEGS